MKKKNSKNYLVMQSITHTPNKTIHICEVPDDQEGDLKFTVGRSSEVAVRITDISVSRFQSLITYHEGDFYIKDLKSKFGTVTRLWHPISIPQNKNYSIEFQVGRTFFRMSYSGKKWNISNNTK